ncbi:hypothetical protein [Thalassobacillus sp. C254]|uniref:hypothetical protein n=1 Tax=Thalassobacillus sp. C254 TaxID=1225341 RepID=UPI0006CFF295|nr:hypothetical protein [Thalassobacillus sp. C254]
MNTEWYSLMLEARRKELERQGAGEGNKTVSGEEEAKISTMREFEKHKASLLQVGRQQEWEKVTSVIEKLNQLQ